MYVDIKLCSVWPASKGKPVDFLEFLVVHWPSKIYGAQNGDLRNVWRESVILCRMQRFLGEKILVARCLFQFSKMNRNF